MTIVESLIQYLTVRGRTDEEIADAVAAFERHGYYEIKGQVTWGTPPEVDLSQAEEVLDVGIDVRGEGALGEPSD